MNWFFTTLPSRPVFHIFQAPSWHEAAERAQALTDGHHDALENATSAWFTNRRYTITRIGDKQKRIQFHWDNGRTIEVYWARGPQLGVSFSQLEVP